MNRDGYVYFIQSGIEGAIKIGFTTNVKSRLSNLQTSSPFELTVLKALPGDREREREIHNLFRDDRLREKGEWFNPSPQLMAYIKSIEVKTNEKQNLLVLDGVKTEKSKADKRLCTPLKKTCKTNLLTGCEDVDILSKPEQFFSLLKTPGITLKQVRIIADKLGLKPYWCATEKLSQPKPELPFLKNNGKNLMKTLIRNDIRSGKKGFQQSQRTNWFYEEFARRQKETVRTPYLSQRLRVLIAYEDITYEALLCVADILGQTIAWK